MRIAVIGAGAIGCLVAGYLKDQGQEVTLFFNNLQVLSEGKMPTVQGGILIRNDAGQIIGSVGISGDTSSNDEICGVAAIKQMGLIADHGDPQ